MTYLGIEIGGTKLQVGVGAGDGSPLVALRRDEIDRSQGAAAIRSRILEFALPLINEYQPQGIGIAFGGPIDIAAGRTVHSHHVSGWENFPLVEWCQKELGLPAVMGNDADLAGLAEAMFGAGRGHRAVFYITVGTGIGGALIYEGKIYTGAWGIAAEIGHLRPGMEATQPERDLESIAAGWGIAAEAAAFLAFFLDRQAKGFSHDWILFMCRHFWGFDDEEAASFATLDQAVQKIVSRINGTPQRVTTKLLGEALAEGNVVAKWVFRRALRALGWAIAQMITLVAPSVVVIGGGVSLLGEKLFFEPLREQVALYVFPPLKGRYSICPANLGEEVMIHGATLLARQTFPSTADSSA